MLVTDFSVADAASVDWAFQLAWSAFDPGPFHATSDGLSTPVGTLAIPT